MMGLSFVGTSLAMKWVMASIDPQKDTKQKVPGTVHYIYCSSLRTRASVVPSLQIAAPQMPMTPCNQAKKRKAELQRRLGRSITLEGLESNIALCVVNPAHIDTTLADIGGLDDIAESLVRHVSPADLRASPSASIAYVPARVGSHRVKRQAGSNP